MQNQAATLPSVKSQLVVGAAPRSSPGRNEVLIKSRAVAINPVDWTMQDSGLFIDKYPYIPGCDVAGVVEEIGQDVEGLRKGDNVISHAVSIIKGPRYAAFQEYVLSPANVTCKLPSQMSFAEGAVLPLAFNTAAIGLFSKDHMGLSGPSIDPKPSEKTIIIYGGSTSVGSVAIQLAKAAGLSVVTTASLKNHDYCEALGADIVFDYNSCTWIQDAANVLRDKEVVGIYDAVSYESTTELCNTLLERLNDPDIGLVTTRTP